MDIRQWAFFCVFIFLGASVHAASFDCKKALSKTEKIICGSDELSHLDSELANKYQMAYAASGQAAQEKLVMAQRAWLDFVRMNCEDEECIAIFYAARIDQLESLAKSGANEDSSESRKPLDFEGLPLGQVLDDKKARKVFKGFACHSDKLMSSIEHQPVVTCEGQTTFEHQQMDADIELHGNHELAGIMLCYDTPYPEEGVNSTSVSDMEDRLIATYGKPDILRTESAHQPVKYDPKDLIGLPGSTDQFDQGGDQWVFAHSASVIMEPCAGHQKVDGGHIFSAEAISFNSDVRRGVLVTFPAHHSIPMVLTKLSDGSGSEQLWKPSELMTVELLTGGKRTCTVEQPVSSPADYGSARYTTAVTCTDFVQITDSAVMTTMPTRVHIIRGGKVLAVGYIPTSKAVAALEHH
jgi:uncharacterized protein